MKSPESARARRMDWPTQGTGRLNVRLETGNPDTMGGRKIRGCVFINEKTKDMRERMVRKET